MRNSRCMHGNGCSAQLVKCMANQSTCPDCSFFIDVAEMFQDVSGLDIIDRIAEEPPGAGASMDGRASAGRASPGGAASQGSPFSRRAVLLCISKSHVWRVEHLFLAGLKSGISHRGPNNNAPAADTDVLLWGVNRAAMNFLRQPADAAADALLFGHVR